MLRQTGIASLVLGLCALPALADDELRFKEPYVAVDGFASVDVVPDRATMRLGVVVEKPTAAEAAAEALPVLNRAACAYGPAGVVAKPSGLRLRPPRRKTSP